MNGWKVHTDINHKHYLENNLVCIANNAPNPIFVSGSSVTNAKYIRGSAMTKKIEMHCSTFSASFDIYEKQTQSSSKQ